jgi:hypothetical protein
MAFSELVQAEGRRSSGFSHEEAFLNAPQKSVRIPKTL